MPEVRVRENENIESALKRFKKKFKRRVSCLKLNAEKDTKNLP